MGAMLLDEHPITVMPSLAKAIGINNAIVVQQIHYWLELNKRAGRNFRDGRYWTYNSFERWNEQFAWWSLRTVKSIFKNLEERNILLSANFNALGIDRTKWYTINYQELDRVLPSCKSCTMDSADVALPIPETNTEPINNGNNGTMDFSRQREKPVLRSKPLDSLDGEISDFIKWYFSRYEEEKWEPHPFIKSDQKKRIHDCLYEFCYDHDLHYGDLQEMAEAFFRVSTSDHNINHFATEGILENRFFEAIY